MSEPTPTAATTQSRIKGYATRLWSRISKARSKERTEPPPPSPDGPERWEPCRWTDFPQNDPFVGPVGFGDQELPLFSDRATTIDMMSRYMALCNPWVEKEGRDREEDRRGREEEGRGREEDGRGREEEGRDREEDGRGREEVRARPALQPATLRDPHLKIALVDGYAIRASHTLDAAESNPIPLYLSRPGPLNLIVARFNKKHTYSSVTHRWQRLNPCLKVDKDSPIPDHFDAVVSLQAAKSTNYHLREAVEVVSTVRAGANVGIYVNTESTPFAFDDKIIPRKMVLFHALRPVETLGLTAATDWNVPVASGKSGQKTSWLVPMVDRHKDRLAETGRHCLIVPTFVDPMEIMVVGREKAVEGYQVLVFVARGLSTSNTFPVDLGNNFHINFLHGRAWRGPNGSTVYFWVVPTKVGAVKRLTALFVLFVDDEGMQAAMKDIVVPFIEGYTRNHGPPDPPRYEHDSGNRVEDRVEDRVDDPPRYDSSRSRVKE